MAGSSQLEPRSQFSNRFALTVTVRWDADPTAPVWPTPSGAELAVLQAAANGQGSVPTALLEKMRTASIPLVALCKMENTMLANPK